MFTSKRKKIQFHAGKFENFEVYPWRKFETNVLVSFVTEVIECLKQWNYAYYYLGEPEVSDSTFDSLRMFLENIFKEKELLLKTRGLLLDQIYDFWPKGELKIRHIVPMLSLRPFKKCNELKEFLFKFGTSDVRIKFLLLLHSFFWYV